MFQERRRVVLLCCSSFMIACTFRVTIDSTYVLTWKVKLYSTSRRKGLKINVWCDATFRTLQFNSTGLF